MDGFLKPRNENNLSVFFFFYNLKPDTSNNKQKCLPFITIKKLKWFEQVLGCLGPHCQVSIVNCQTVSTNGGYTFVILLTMAGPHIIL